MKITLRGIVNLIKSVAETAVAILPIVRRFFPQVEQVVDQVEDAVEQGGEDAADWINQHPEVLAALTVIGDRLMDVGSAVKTLATVAHGAAADGVVAPAEAEQLLRALDMIRRGIAGSGEIETALATVAAASE